MLVTSPKKPEPVRIPVRGAMRRKGEKKHRIVGTIKPLRVRLRSSHR